MVRTWFAVGLSTVMFAVGLYALSYQSQSVQSTALNSSNKSASVYNTTNTVFNGVGQAGANALAWGGVGAVVVVALGVLVVAGRSGGR